MAAFTALLTPRMLQLHHSRFKRKRLQSCRSRCDHVVSLSPYRNTYFNTLVKVEDRKLQLKMGGQGTKSSVRAHTASICFVTPPKIKNQHQSDAFVLPTHKVIIITQ
jgi:hypothetical protein